MLASFGLTVSRMHPISSALDKGVEPNLIREDLLEVDRLRPILGNKIPARRNATCQKASVVGKIRCHVRVSGAKVTVLFSDVRNLTRPVLLGTSFVERFVRHIFPSEQKTVAIASNRYRYSSLIISQANKRKKTKRHKMW